MTKEEFLEKVSAERDYQDAKWGHEFDNLNTVNDWIVYLARYAGMASTGERGFHKAMIKTAAIACAAVETYERRGGLEPRHYDPGELFFDPEYATDPA